MHDSLKNKKKNLLAATLALVVVAVAIFSYLYLTGFFIKTEQYTFSNSEITVGVPSGWIITEESETKVVFEEPSNDGLDQAKLQIALTEMAELDDATFYERLDDDFANEDESLRKTIRRGKVTKTEKLEIAGFPAYKIYASKNRPKNESSLSFSYLIRVKSNLVITAILEHQESDTGYEKMIDKGFGEIRI